MIYLRLGLILACLECAVGIRILAFLPFPGKSHHFAFQPTLRGLANKGHQVDYYTPVPMPNPPPNLKEIPVKDHLAGFHSEMDMKSLIEGSIPSFSAAVTDLTLFVCEKLFQEDLEVNKLVNSKEKYDVVIVGVHFGQEFAASFVHKFNAVGVALLPLFDSTWVNELAGLPDNPSYMIDFKSPYTDIMSFGQRLYNVYIWTATTAISYYYALFTQQRFADKYIRYEGWESRPSVVKMVSNMSLILVNSHHSLGYPYPKAPHVKEIGGINLAPNKPLPKDLQTFMDDAKNGVIYFSYGSHVDMAHMMADGTFDVYVDTFKQLKQKILWKWKGSEIPKIKLPNVKFQEWFPQQDILAHPNTKLFITHGGLMSMIEAINYGVPIIGTAAFADQPKNLKMVENAGIGIELKYNNITHSSLSWAVNEILTNDKYKMNMMKRRDLFRDRPMKPVDEAVYWIEYVAKHGNVLQPASVHMPFYQVYLLDVLGTLIVALFISLFIFKRILRLVCFLVCSKKTTESKRKSKKE